MGYIMRTTLNFQSFPSYCEFPPKILQATSPSMVPPVKIFYNLIFILAIVTFLSKVDPERDKHGEIDDAVGNKKYPESPGHGGSP